MKETLLTLSRASDLPLILPEPPSDRVDVFGSGGRTSSFLRTIRAAPGHFERAFVPGTVGCASISVVCAITMSDDREQLHCAHCRDSSAFARCSEITPTPVVISGVSAA